MIIEIPTNSSKLIYPVMYSEANGSITPIPIIKTVKGKHRNITLAIKLGGRMGNVLFGVESGLAIAAHYGLNLCVNGMSPAYKIFLDMAPLLNIIPKTCSNQIQKSLQFGHKINVYGHSCFGFQYVSVTHGNFSKKKSLLKEKMMTLSKVFGQQPKEKVNLVELHFLRHDWKYLKIGPKKPELRLKNKVISDAKKKLYSFGHIHKRVAIHLRVGDLSQRSKQNFPGPQYFQKAMQYFREKWVNVTFLVFSDNPAWCTQQSLFNGKDVHVKERGSKSMIAEKNNDFALISVSDGFIHSIGSFGWWSGHFSSQSGGQVVYFKNYFPNSVDDSKLSDCQQRNAEDYFPPHWIGLKAPSLENIINGNKIEVEYLKGDILARSNLASFKAH